MAKHGVALFSDGAAGYLREPPLPRTHGISVTSVDLVLNTWKGTSCLLSSTKEILVVTKEWLHIPMLGFFQVL